MNGKGFLQETLDQLLHFGVALLAVTIIQPFEVWQCAFLGFMLGLVREFTEGGNILSKGSVLDMIFWTLGGFIGGISFLR